MAMDDHLGRKIMKNKKSQREWQDKELEGWQASTPSRPNCVEEVITRSLLLGITRRPIFLLSSKAILRG